MTGYDKANNGPFGLKVLDPMASMIRLTLKKTPGPRFNCLLPGSPFFFEKMALTSDYL